MRFLPPPGAPDLDFCWPLQYETTFCENQLSPLPRAFGLEKVMKMSSKYHENRSPGRPKTHAGNRIEKDMENESKSPPKMSPNQHKST